MSSRSAITEVGEHLVHVPCGARASLLCSKPEDTMSGHVWHVRRGLHGTRDYWWRNACLTSYGTRVTNCSSET